MEQNILKGLDEVKEIPKISIGKLFFDGISQFGNRVCLVDGITNEHLTFRQVLEKSVKLAVALKRLGFKKNDVIAIASENLIEFYIPFLASLYSGIIFNILNPDYTKYEFQIYLERLNPRYVFCSKSSLQKIQELKQNLPAIQSIIFLGPRIEADVIYLNDLINLGESDISKFQLEEFDPKEQVAMTYNSSGTTGLPKNVLLTHSNVRAVLIQCGKYGIDVKSDDVFVHNLPFFSVISLIAICCSFVYGSKMVVLGKFHPETFLKTIDKYKPTKMLMVPYLVMFVVKTLLLDKYDLSSIKNCICGSSPISKESIEKFIKRLPGCKFNQMYGLTESSAICIYNHSQENVGSIGHVMPEVQLKIVDGKGNLLGPNEMGELCINGTGITKGYYKNEKATKESFDGDGFFKTGDVGYYDEKHFVYIIDRVKDIFTYKGFQVSPSEIEFVLLLHEGVRDVGVIGVPDERAGEAPLAFIVLREGHQVSEKELHAFVAEHLSTAKHLHGGIRFIAKIPRIPNGKVDRKVLRSIVANSSP